MMFPFKPLLTGDFPIASTNHGSTHSVGSLPFRGWLLEKCPDKAQKFEAENSDDRVGWECPQHRAATESASSFFMAFQPPTEPQTL